MVTDKPKPIVTNNATIHPTYWTEYSVLQNRCDFAQKVRITPDSTKGENKHNHGISIAAGRKIKKVINMLVFISDDKKIYPKDENSNLTFKINLLTLSLPCSQLHSDEFIKSNLLGPYLKALKYHFGMINYFWKAESKDNDTIHFHITTDCYMDKDKARSLWNHQLEKYGYVARYRENQIEKHKDGFYYNKQQYFINFKTNEKTKINYVTQKKAYDSGVACGWTNPNTTDLHSVRSVANLAGYLVSYLSKKDLWKKAITPDDKKNITKMEKDKIPLDEIQRRFTHCVKRSISGKLWDCSTNLKNTGLKIESIEQYHNEFSYMKQNEVERVIYLDRCTVYIRKPEFIKMYPPAICELMNDYIEQIKFDCVSIEKHLISLHNDEELQKLLTASNCSTTTAQTMSNVKRHGRPPNTGRSANPSRAYRQTSLQLRF